MNQKVKQLEEKLQRLNIALSRLSKDKKEARQTLVTDIKKVQQEIVLATSAPAQSNKSVNLTTIILGSVLLAVAIGFISFFSTGGSL